MGRECNSIVCLFLSLGLQLSIEAQNKHKSNYGLKVLKRREYNQCLSQQKWVKCLSALKTKECLQWLQSLSNHWVIPWEDVKDVMQRIHFYFKLKTVIVDSQRRVKRFDPFSYGLDSNWVSIYSKNSFNLSLH